IRGIDDDGDAGVLVADEIGRTAEVVVDELREEHAATLTPRAAISPEVKRLLLAAVAAAALAAPAPGWAHASVVRSGPSNGAVLARPPAAVRVVFDDTVRAGDGIAAIRNGGGSVLGGPAHVERGRTLVVPLRARLVDGDYSVRWSVVSDDGHLESGVLAFAVGAGRAAPLSALAPLATGPTADGVAARWLFFAGILAAVGLSLFTLVARPLDDERVPLLLSTACVLLAIR